MEITLKLLQDKKACGDGQRWFKKHFPNGADINSVMVMILTDDDAPDSWVSWLMCAAEWKDLSFLNGLTIGGSLDLSDTQITALPEGLSVGGSLYLSGTQITALPEGLSVGGSLYLSDTQITALPEGLSVGGYLDLRGTQITALPEGLSVGGSLDLRGSKVSNVPAHLKSKVVR